MDTTSLAAEFGAGIVYGLPIAALLGLLLAWIVGVRGDDEAPFIADAGEPADDPVSGAYRAIAQGDLTTTIEALDAAVADGTLRTGSDEDRRKLRREIRRLRDLALRAQRPPGWGGAERRRRQRAEFRDRSHRLFASLRIPDEGGAG